jgi:hypothetical protein
MELLANAPVRENDCGEKAQHSVDDEHGPRGKCHNQTPESGSGMVPLHVVTGEPAMVLVPINISFGDEPLNQRLMMIESKSPSLR